MTMPAKTDLDTETSDITGDDDVEEKKSDKPVIDYKRKFEGNTKTIERLMRKLQAVEGQLETIEDTHAEALAAERLKSVDATKRANDLESKLGETDKVKTDLEKRLNSITAEREQAQTVREKYPNLVDLFEGGDLRKPTDFGTPEDYDAYLDRMDKWAGADAEVAAAAADKQQRTADKAKGATPQVSARRTGNTTSKDRTIDDISADMWKLDPRRSPEEKARYVELERELLGLGQ
jgi:hypothetical protein